MAEETPVTLDYLPSIGLTSYVEPGELGACYRCGSVVWNDDSGNGRAAHERWHAAIETEALSALAVTIQGVQLEVTEEFLAHAILNAMPSPAGPVLPYEAYQTRPINPVDEDSCAKHREFINRVWQIATEAGHESGTSVTDFLRERLQAQQEPAAPHEWSTQDMANTLTSQGAALERLREVVRAAGCPPQAEVIGWIEERLNDLVGSDQREAALIEANRGLSRERDRLRADAGASAQTEQPDEDPRVTAARAARDEAEQQRDRIERLYIDTQRQLAGIFPLVGGNAGPEMWQLIDAARTAAHKVAEQSDPDMPRTAGALADTIDLVRRELGHALKVDPVSTPFNQMVELVEHVMYANGRCKTEHAGLSKGETDRLRRVEQALIAVGAPDRSGRGDPGGLMVAWIQRQAERMAEYRRRERAVNTQPVEQVCPSLYLHNGTLVQCDNTLPASAGHANLMMELAWDDTEAVPSPWPVDREPPAGITLLEDQDDQIERYLVRVEGIGFNGRDMWKWSASKDGSGSNDSAAWKDVVMDAEGELVVVRP